MEDTPIEKNSRAEESVNRVKDIIVPLLDFDRRFAAGSVCPAAIRLYSSPTAASTYCAESPVRCPVWSAHGRGFPTPLLALHPHSPSLSEHKPRFSAASGVPVRG